ncbi:Extended Signal Peptide of Type V secretion system [Paraburkholderia tropica]|uniref:Extended Signal Peptide of Type V secretion system n=1 Tax=Paraburkholderia tropica TaxID=92647 RepID=A0AAQ1GHZ6_9BURK|nr:Extended Signal Peptide of Type V secretion system [Paraburkholderia tropica]
MNRNFRLVYSRVRHMVVAVEETATASGGRGKGEVVVAAAMMLAGMAAGAQAQVVAGGAHAPQVQTTPNATPLVNLPFNAKRVYRVMSTHGLSMERRAAPPRPQRRHDGKVAVARSNQRWCSDGFEFRCDNGEPLRVTFALDCCDREAMSWAATTAGHSGDIVRDVMLAAVENRFGDALHSNMGAVTLLKWAGVPNSLKSISTVPGFVVQLNKFGVNQTVGRGAHALTNSESSKNR